MPPHASDLLTKCIEYTRYSSRALRTLTCTEHIFEEGVEVCPIFVSNDQIVGNFIANFGNTNYTQK